MPSTRVTSKRERRAGPRRPGAPETRVGNSCAVRAAGGATLFDNCDRHLAASHKSFMGTSAWRPHPSQAPAAVAAEAWRRITKGLDRFLDRVDALEGYPPGAAVVVVAGRGRRYVRVHGETRAGSGYSVTPDDPMERSSPWTGTASATRGAEDA
jgi:hypothetical protein